MNVLNDGRKLEFVCPRCLVSVHRLDTDRVPRCARCLVKMLPDSSEPVRRPQSGRRKPAPRQPDLATAAAKGKARSSGGEGADAA